jgi:hypothetical protein
MKRLPLALGALAFSTIVGAAQAEAGHAHFSGAVHFGGGAHWGGGVHVGGWGGGGGGVSYHWSRPAWRPSYWGVHGSIWVGGYYPYYYRPYYYYYPEYVPSYYGSSYYPVETTAAPGATAVLAPRPELPKLGIGLFAGGVNVQDQYGNSVPDSSDVGVLARYRLTPGLLVEGELGKTSYNVDGNDNLRVDRRLGASAIYEIGAYNAFAPYVLAGLGVQQADVSGDYSTTQDFAEIGAGLRWALTPHFHLTADIRLGSRHTVSNDQTQPATTTARMVTPPPTTSADTSEDYTRGRIAAILYF